MSACLLVDATSSAISITSTEPSSCAGYILLTSAEYNASNPFSEFDVSIASELFAYMLGMFISAYAVGIIARKLGR